MPYITFIISYTLKLIARLRDRGLTGDQWTTRMLTIQSYINLHCGPEVTLHIRYANILNQVFVAFTYGLALPLLFPICLMGLINMYITERFQVVYFYREPPVIDNQLNDRALRILMLAPVLMLCFTYWLLGNRQMFYNEHIGITYSNSALFTKHEPFDFSKGVDVTLLILFFIPLFLFFRKVGKIFLKVL
jgi:hypothetical protein